MERDVINIPEAFRRAMEDYDWDGNGDNNGEGGQGPPSLPQGCGWQLAILVGLLLLALSFEWIVTTYTDWLWFVELGYEQVWLTQWGVQIASFALFFVVSVGFLWFNWRVALSSAFSRPTKRMAAWFAFVNRSFGWLIGGLALMLSYLFATGGASQWEVLLRYFNSIAYGVEDPIFGLDISFYLFELPVYAFLRGWFSGLLFITIMGVIVLYAMSDWLRIQHDFSRLLQIDGLRRHVAILGAFWMLLWAVGYWLDGYGLLFSSQGVVVGAGYTDINATLLMLRVQTGLMILLALTFLVNASRLWIRGPLAVGGLSVLVGLLLGGVYPYVLQSYVVVPNELAREEPYIEHNIEFTRRAFDLEGVQSQPFEIDKNITAADLADNEEALRNVRLWDYRPLKDAYSQLQELRPYYQFSEVDIDRYPIDGISRQVMLAGRELNQEQLTSRSWVNENLKFTHGYGIVMNPVDRVTEEGQPDFFISDLPPQSTVEIEITRPEIYYGELPANPVYVNSGLPEFDYPSGNQNVDAFYEGTGGVPLGGFLQQMLFAVRFRDFNLLLSEYITPETRTMYYRQIEERVQHITPFLAFDNDPYLVVADGRLVWILDAYTLSNRFPYAKFSPHCSCNYIRNAAKVTVDAYNGEVNYYLADTDDPLVLAYSSAFPDLFKRLEEMPPELQSHLRYPEDLFTIQTEQYLTYHMTDVQVFYNEEDLWEIPNEVFENNQQIPVAPYYVIFSLPGESETEFLLIRPYVPRGKDNMIAWIAARNDMPHYGELVVYELPKQELVFGPLQIESRIDQDPTISSQISLWNQQGSGVIRGNLLAIPIGNSFLYVEPLYLQSESSALPELKRVIVASPTNIIMRETLDEALAALVNTSSDEGDVVVIDPTPAPDTTTDDASSEPAPEGSTNPDATVEELILSANAHFLAAEEAQRAGDWATYGRELEALEQDLARLMELSGETLPAGTP